MIDPLQFLSKLKSIDLPPVIHLMGDDDWIQEVVRRRLIEHWCGEGESDFDRLVGAQGAADLVNHFGAASLFAMRKVLVLCDPSPTEKGTSLASMGKNQQAAFFEACGLIPRGMDLLLVQTGMMKSTSVVLKGLSKIALGVDASPPKGAVRRTWIDLMARKAEVTLSPELAEAMAGSEIPLGVLKADLEKLALAVEPGAEAPLEIWKDLTQADPEATVWEIGDHLTLKKTGQLLKVLHDLRTEGLTIHDLLPALFTWCQQRLQIKAHEASKRGGSPEGVHPFVLKKIGSQLNKIPLAVIREEALALYRLDRISKQSLENPELALEKTLVSISERKR